MSNTFKYSFSSVAGDKYYYGTDMEKLDNNISDSILYKKNAKELESDVDNITKSFSRVQENVTDWIGNSSEAALGTINRLLDCMKVVLGNITNSIVPACENMEKLKASLQSLKTEDDYYIGLKKELASVVNTINTFELTEDNDSEYQSLVRRKNDLLLQAENQRIKLDKIVEETIGIYNLIEQFENELGFFELYFGSDFDNILDDQDRFMALDSITMYLLASGSYYCNQSGPELLFSILSKNENFLTSLDETHHLPDGFGILGNKWNCIIDVFNKHGYTTIQDIVVSVYKAGKMGCGFAAVANNIFDIYKDNPEHFEEVYGYPLYFEDDGKIYYNYEALLIDTFIMGIENGYISELNTSSSKDLFMSLGSSSALNIEYIGPLYESMLRNDPLYSETIDSSGVLYLNFQPIERASDNLDNVIYTSATDTPSSTVELYRQYIDEYDYAVIAAYNYDLVPLDNLSSIVHHSDGGHWMKIIGVSENDNFIVTSWGKRYELVKYENRVFDTENDEYYYGGELTFFKCPSIDSE